MRMRIMMMMKELLIVSRLDFVLMRVCKIDVLLECITSRNRT